MRRLILVGELLGLLLVLLLPAPAASIFDGDAFSNPIFDGHGKESAEIAQETPAPPAARTAAPAPAPAPAAARASQGGSWSTTRASWYECCKKTANGERFNPDGLTGAHRSLPFGTRVEVCTSRCVVIRINDRGPFVAGRTLDLSRGAFRQIASLSAGVVSVRWRVI